MDYKYNPEKGYLNGLPARDITEEEVKRFTPLENQLLKQSLALGMHVEGKAKAAVQEEQKS